MRPWIWFRYFPAYCTALIDLLIAPDIVKHEPGEIVSAFLPIPGTNPYGYSREIFIKIDN